MLGPAPIGATARCTASPPPTSRVRASRAAWARPARRMVAVISRGSRRRMAVLLEDRWVSAGGAGIGAEAGEVAAHRPGLAVPLQALHAAGLCGPRGPGGAA